MSFGRSLMPLILILSLALTNHARAGPTEHVLHGFPRVGGGFDPASSLVLDASGNLYGTSQAGGSSNCSSGCGVVFELTPSANGRWKEKVLYTFQGGTDGGGPAGNVLFDALGNLYGTTEWGGTPSGCPEEYHDGCGTVFQLSPNPDGSWTESVLYRFQGSPDGSQPAGLNFDAAGNLYGTSTGNYNAQGATVYELSPPRQRGGEWTERILAAFDGLFEVPNAGLAIDSHGNLFGTTQVPYWGSCTETCGQVFEIARKNGTWATTTLYAFPGGGNGASPAAGVIFDSKGNLYGTTRDGGNNFGIAFKLRHQGKQWKPALLYNFCSSNNCADGAHPLAALVFDQSGTLYGTTYSGGRGCYTGPNGCGVVFELSKTKSGWRETILHRFTNDPDGSKPAASLIFDDTGNIYGTTFAGGDVGAGTVFEIVP